MKEKPVLLVFSDWFAPGYKAGGPISSISNFVYLMKARYAVYVFTSDTDHGETAPYKNIIPDTWMEAGENDFKVYYAKKSKLNGRQIRQAIADVKPDFVYLNNMFSPYFVLYPVFMKWRGLLKAKTIITPRGTLYDSALAVKPLKKKIFIKVFRWLGWYKPLLFQATSKREQQAIEHFFPGSQVQVADDLPSMVQPPYQSIEKIAGKVKCIFISRIVPIKNLLFLLQLLMDVKRPVELTVAGPVEDAGYWGLCVQQIKKLPVHIQVNYIGSLPAAELPALIQQHHVYILPTRGENFGHTIFEALLSGRPVLISDQTPWLNLQLTGAGWDLPLDNSGAYANVIEEVAGWNQQLFDERSMAAWHHAEKYLATADFGNQYFSLFK